MKTILLALSLLLLTACDAANYHTNIDCGDAANKQLIKESFEGCLKNSNSTAQTCAALTQKLFCKHTRIKNTEGHK